MNKNALPYIVCPMCKDNRFTCEEFKSDEYSISEGRLICDGCGIWYRIENGIIDMLTLSMRRDELYGIFADKYGLEFDKSLGVRHSKKDVQIDFFDKSSNDYDEKVTGSPYFIALDSLVFHGWVRRSLTEGQWILELGCGTGRQCAMVASRRIHTIGIDISEEMLIVAQEKLLKKGLDRYVNLIVADAENPPIKNDALAACVIVGTLHHVNDPESTVLNGVKKVTTGGGFFSYDPHRSPVRFIFDFAMSVCKLYDEHANDHPLMTEKVLRSWLEKAGIQNKIRISTFILPHLFYLFSDSTNRKLLQYTDAIFGSIPLLRKFGGMIIAEGRKQS
jgi:ubiquinone/menaquinone biosynthesis C-methylase UbiE/uncharacterized protein YbaR (Trm112 family)